MRGESACINIYDYSNVYRHDYSNTRIPNGLAWNYASIWKWYDVRFMHINSIKILRMDYMWRREMTQHIINIIFAGILIAIMMAGVWMVTGRINP